ncbi:MAG: hypothetical protein II937_06930 [Bacteroidales bacterium]|nr:hypothetical protein [Bacteroidales bacterium]
MENENPNLVSENETSQNQIKCSCCGAKLTFAPGTLSLKCEYCGTMNEIKIDEALKEEAVKELDYLSALKELESDENKEVHEIHTVKCQACGAETTFSENVISDKCDFCGSPLTVNQGTTVKKIKPKALIPFSVERFQGDEMYKKWLKDLWFAPSDLKKSAMQENSLSGVYLPYWTYDAKTVTNYSGKRGTDYYTEERYKDEQGQEKVRRVRHTNWTLTSGVVKNVFDDIVQAASSALPLSYLNSLEPWNLNALVPYDEKFMSGFKTETYSIDLKQGFEGAKEIMDSEIESTIREDIGGDHQQIDTKNINFYDITFKHILLPIWISSYRYNGKSYRFVVNGQSGKVRGERPYSTMKIIMAVLAVIAVLCGFYFLLRK